MKRVRSISRGFTLIEAMVALAIAAVVISGFYSALSTGSLLDRRAAQQAAKVFLATTVLDRVGVDIPMRLGTVETGIVRDMEWQLIISGSPAADMALGQVYPNELVFVSVSVSDPQGTSSPVVLRTIRYAQSPL